ncbi:hypothetical protein, partial [Priestia megaterium]|uniref:hypothetical protein n=1 Tax=Priestia megaterium TaxID=1404 RepID=UPI001C98EA7D
LLLIAKCFNNGRRCKCNCLWVDLIIGVCEVLDLIFVERDMKGVSNEEVCGLEVMKDMSEDRLNMKKWSFRFD